MFGALKKALPLINRGGFSLINRQALSSVSKRWAHQAPEGGVSSNFSSESILEFTTFYLIIPIIIWARIHSYYEMKREIEAPVHLPPRYEYLGMIKKPFPWGDGKTPLFGWPRGRSPEEYEARKAAGLPMPDRLDDFPPDDDEDEE